MSAERTLLAGIASVLTAAGSVVKVSGGPRILLAKLGWDLPPGVDDIGLAGLDMARVGDRLNAWTTLEVNPEASIADKALALADLAEAAVEVLADLGDLRLQAPQDYLDRSGIKDEFLTRLFDLYLIQAAAVASRPVFDVAVLLGWFELQRHDADPARFQVAHLRHVVHWDRVPMLFNDPTRLLRKTYGWGTATFDADALVTRIGCVLQHLAAEVRRRELPAIPLARLHGGTPPSHQPQIQLFLPLLGSSGSLTGEVGISVFGLPPTAPGGIDGGLGFAPYAEGTASLRIPLSSTLSIGMSAHADLGSGLALVLRPGRAPLLRTGLNEPQAGTGGPGAQVQLDLTLAVPQGAEPVTLLSAGGARLEAASVALALGAAVDGDGTDAALRLQLKGGRLTLTPEGLPFLEAVPTDGLVADADVDLSWSHRHGVRLGGRAELKTSMAIGRQIGPVTLDVLEIGLAAGDGGVALTAAVSATVKLGPVRLIVEQIGVRAAITPGPGSLGSADLTIRPTPPSGIGVAIDAPGVVGGGFLQFDRQKEEYSGVLELQIEETIAVKAIGLLITRLPDGARGYSLLIVITAEDFKPIPLPLGFRLTGIGGLLAINRTFDEAVLRSGLKNHTLDSVLFPKDPIRIAPQILSNLNKVFPPANGHHLFGPMARIAWGTPTLITADLALVLEMGARLRLLVLAQVVAILPKPENDLVRLQMDGVGVLDFDQGTAALDATLYDSRLLKKFVLTGDMAMRLKWENSPNFALAIGGLHPAFNPPPNFPKLERIALNLTAGDNPRFRCEAYFALTSNTVQFGARAELYAAAAGFSIQGETGFDVLIQLDPFFFLADYYAQVQLKRGSTNLFKVRVEGALAGPRPLHIKGKATFEILWWDVSIRFDKTLVEGEKPPPPEPVDVLPRLKEALAHAGNWRGRLPDGQPQMVTLRAKPGAPSDVLLHPLGTLSVKQGVVPLDMDISRFGQAPPAGARRFTISSVSLGGQSQTAQPVKDFFAPAQFFEMSDDEKLSRPSFEPMPAGVIIGSAEIAFTADASDWLEVEAIEFETWIVDKEKTETRPSHPEDSKNLYRLSPELLGRQARFGAAGASDLRRTGKARYRTIMDKHRIAKEGWSVVATDDLKVQPVPGIEADKPATYSEAAQALRKLKQENPAKAAGLKILRLSETETVGN